MSTLKVNTIEEATSNGRDFYFIRVWVNYSNLSSVNTIRAEKGVSSVSDTGTGAFQVNFDTAFANAFYATAGMNGDNGSSTNNAAISYNTGSGANGNTTTFRRFSAENVDSGMSDYTNNTILFSGDQ
jgi:hypothetical protein